MNPWLSAVRPRTLPLALSSIIMGGFLAAKDNFFSWSIFGLAILTTICLQVLSNFANDYGDSKSGVDSKDRKVATRAVQMGFISANQMKNAMILMAALSLLSGCTLLYISLNTVNIQTYLWFLLLGILAIIAAITYTVGKNPYGYAGFGDISVLIFFGFVGVCGTYFLFSKQFHLQYLLPASSCGMFAMAVLNVNNIRDIETDTATGKLSIPVRIGREKAKFYHWTLLILGLSCSIFYVFLYFESLTQYLFLLTFPIFISLGMGIQKGQNPADFDPFLKKTALTTLLFVLLFGVGNLL